MRTFLLSLLLAQVAFADPSTVYRLELPGLLPQHSVQVTLFHRDGRFHQAWAEIPTRDNLVHDVDPNPSQPIAFARNDGTIEEIPEKLQERYAYRQPEFGRYRSRYEAGTLNIIHPIPTPPLSVSADGRTLEGTLDLMIYETDVPNTGGWQVDALVYRLAVNAAIAPDGSLTGQAKAWRYEKGDYDYGAAQPRTELSVRGRRLDTFWQADPAQVFATGKNWPQVYGPFGTGSAIDCDQPLIDNLHDARLVWVSEERIGGGRGSGSRRADFAMFPQPWTGLGYGGYASPAVVDGKVFLHHMFADREVIQTREGIERDPFLRLGNPIESLANAYDGYRDAVLCLDARTGQTLWHWKGDRLFGDIPSSKGGRGTTTAVADGKVFAVGHGGLYCLDAATGDLLWQKGGDQGEGYGSGGGTWSREMSPVIIGGSIILIRDDKALGIDPADGSLRWVVRQAAGDGAVAQKIVLEGREYLVCVGEVSRIHSRDLKKNPDLKPAPEDLLLIDPVTGEVLVRSQALGSSNMQPLVWQDLVIANGIRDLIDPFAKKKKNDPKERERIAAARMSLHGANRLWLNEDVHWPPFRATPVAHRGVAYIDSATGFSAVDLLSGKRLGRHPEIFHISGGDHNWTWHVASNNRIITSGLLMFSTADEGFNLLPGRLSIPVAQGYMCPVKPALADGRLILRTERAILCYDLRATPATRGARILTLTAEHAVPGLGPDRDGSIAIRLRERDGRLLSIGAETPAVLSRDRLGIADWLGERRHAQFRTSDTNELTLDTNGLRGDAILRLGDNHEPWSFDLKADGDGYSGTYTRRATPLTNPITIQAGVGGQYLPRPDGSGAVWAFDLGNCIGGPESLAKGRADQALSVVVRVDAEGRVLGGLANSGRTNTMPWELDPGTLAVVDGRLKGTCTILVRDDEYQDVHPERALEQLRPSADGGTLAISLTLNASHANGQLNGNVTGAIGVPWEHSGQISGSWKAQTP